MRSSLPRQYFLCYMLSLIPTIVKCQGMLPKNINFIEPFNSDERDKSQSKLKNNENIKRDLLEHNYRLYEEPNNNHNDSIDRTLYNVRKKSSKSSKDDSEKSKSKKYSSAPSFAPSLSTAESPQPPFFSSTMPTTSPSALPSNVPTSTPFLSTLSSSSLVPSETPSVSPTVMSSNSLPSNNDYYPSQIPSTEPSVTPSFMLLPTDNPSSKPSVSPSETHSVQPSVSQIPSSTPSSSPSVTPTAAPSVSPYVSNELISSCIPASLPPPPPPSDELEENLILTFDYNLYFVSDKVEEAIQVMETKIHNELASKYLNCGNNDDDFRQQPFKVVKISSAPMDVFDEDQKCDTTNDADSPGVCVLIHGGITLDILFFNQRRQLLPRQPNDDFLSSDGRVLQQTKQGTAHDIYKEFGNFLQSSMADGIYNDGSVVFQASFQGLTNTNSDRQRTGDGNNNSEVDLSVDKLQAETNISPQDGNNITIGFVAVAFAAICLLLVSMLIFRRKRHRQDDNHSHLDDLSAAKSDLSVYKTTTDESTVEQEMDYSNIRSVPSLSNGPSGHNDDDDNDVWLVMSELGVMDDINSLGDIDSLADISSMTDLNSLDHVICKPDIEETTNAVRNQRTLESMFTPKVTNNITTKDDASQYDSSNPVRIHI